MEIIIYVLAIYGLSFLARQSDGPWGIMAWIRNKLMTNKYVGVFVFKLLDCAFCSGCWTGWAIYLLTQESYKLGIMFSWGLAGGVICLLGDALFNKLHQE